MFKLLLIFIFTGHLLWSATSDQIEHYLSVSSAEEELLLLESQFSAMQNGFSEDKNGEKETYDMELLSVRFKDYLERNLSENEMDEVLKNYKSVVYLQYTSTTMISPEQNETEAYIKALEADEEAKERVKILEDINKALHNKDSMIVMFDELMKPLMQNGIGGADMNDEMMKQRRVSYMKSMIENAKKETLYNLKDFSIEELEALLLVVKTPAMGYELKAVYGATAYALKEFFLSMASRYDVSKHQPKQTSQETNSTK